MGEDNEYTGANVDSNVDTILAQQRAERQSELEAMSERDPRQAAIDLANNNYNIVGPSIPVTNIGDDAIQGYANAGVQLQQDWASLSPEERATALQGAAETAVGTTEPINWSVDPTMASGEGMASNHDITMAAADFQASSLDPEAYKAGFHESVHARQYENMDNGATDELTQLQAEFDSGAQSSFQALMQSEGTRDDAPPVLQRMYHQLPNEAEAYTAETMAGAAYETAQGAHGEEAEGDGEIA